jgi:hypothetical protein
LVDVLSQDYPLDHEAIIYRCATLPIQQPHIRRVTLRELPTTDITSEETLVLPPADRPRHNDAIRERLAALDKLYQEKQATA